MRPLLAIAVVCAFYCCSSVFAQVGMGMAMPPLGATSPLGSDPGTPVAGTGIPMGPSIPSSPIVSSLPGYPTGAGSMECSTLGIPPAAAYRSPSSYDGGGVTLNGTTSPATAETATSGAGVASPVSLGTSATSGLSTTSGMAPTAGLSGMCGSGASSVASSSAPTSASSTMPSTRSGIPLDSTEISNRGVSSWAATPMTSVSPTAGAASSATTSPLP